MANKLSYWSFPGCLRLFQKEVTEVFCVNPLSKPCKEVYYALHAWRYLLTKIRKDLSLAEIGEITGCTRMNVYLSVNAARNLIETDKNYAYLFDELLNRVSLQDEKERTLDKDQFSESRRRGREEMVA